MLAELKDKSQVTIPKSVINELGLVRGDMFDVVVSDGTVMLVPVVVYPKAKAERLGGFGQGCPRVGRRGRGGRLRRR